MYLYLIEQEVNNDYDSYDSAVVAANTIEEAKNIHPGGAWKMAGGTWCEVKDVQVSLIGVAALGTLPGIVLSSFNAG